MMRLRTICSLFLAAALCLAPAACSSSSKGTTVKELNALGDKVDKDLTEYIALTEPTKPDAKAWLTYFNKGAKLRASLRTNFDAWSKGLEDAIAHGEKPSNATDTQRYRDILGAWLSDQEEEATLTAGCFDAGAPTADTASCFQDMLAKNGARWTNDANVLNQARGKGTKATPRNPASSTTATTMPSTSSGSG